MTDRQAAAIKPQNISGVILCGGQSLRFGSNKALTEVGGLPVIKRVADTMVPLFCETILITNSPDDYSFLDLPMYQDIIKGIGPLGGIYTGLSHIKNNTAFFAACDMPFLNQDLIKYMIDMSQDYDITVPRQKKFSEPLHAIYSKSCIPVIQKKIDSNCICLM